jgi:hypothetical protein
VKGIALIAAPLFTTWALAAGGIPGPPPGWSAPAHTGFLARWECRTGPADTAGLGAFDGPVEVVAASDTTCIVRYESPALPAPRQRGYALEQVPVWRAGDSLETSFRPGGAFSGEGNPADTGAYELALSGSKSLAVSMGGGGALGLDAALFVNVNGQVAENAWLEGTLSDQNVPVQPEGNTTTLREVDTKYLRVYGRQYEYWLGDYTLSHGYAGEDLFSVQAEGAKLRYGEKGRKGSLLFARSKGLFHSDTLRGVDGKQRGYYLRDREGATFITVLAGTERLYRNGTLLRRGIDYTIDYSQGRIDFLTGVAVTGENLFSVEFQYTEESYPRLLLGGEAADTAGAFRFSLRGIRESEDGENPASGKPDEATLQYFRGLGDSVAADSLGRRLRMPRTLSSAVFAGEWEGGEAGQGRFTLLGSQLDQNTYSSLDDGDNLGFSTRYRGEHAFGKPLDQGGVARVVVEPEHEHRSRDFASFHQLVEQRAFRDAWNLDAAVGERDFDANRLRLTLEPWSGWRAGAGAGLALGRTGDSASGGSAPRARSRRGEVFADARAGNATAGVSAEVKLASDPRRRDNHRQRAAAGGNFAGWLPTAEVLHDQWLTATSTASNPDALAESRLWQPRAALESPPLGDRWVWTTGADALYGRSNYGDNEPAVRDSLIDLGLSQRLRLLSWGPWSGDVYAARRHHRTWLPQADGTRPAVSEAAVYDQAEANVLASDLLRGYAAQMHYRASRTAETPLVESYVAVDPGRGDYVYDSLFNTYYRSETGGDYVLAGLVRDSTLGTRPYQDLQWSLHVDLSPGKFSFSPGGVLADADLALDIETDHQDSASETVPLPRFTDSQIDAVRSGRARYEPSLRWTGPEGDRSAHLRYRREYLKSAGIYAFRELDNETEAEYRHQWNEDWEASWTGLVQSKLRQTLDADAGAGESRVNAQRTRTIVYRHFPRAFTLGSSLEYRRAAGEDAGFPLNLQGVVPSVRVEKGAFFGGRASGEYGLYYLFGRGEGSYFATDGYRRGATHRVELLAQSEVQTHLHLNASYLARLEPGASSWSQRFSAEARAVF